ncbi:MAG: hypothetical protein FOGNACKC_05983 [Anaerolineae bacterium]|nr:hypothetical protein [Anaerolineae bacterium]
MSQLRQLTEINIDDLITAFGLQQVTVGRRFIRALGRWPAGDFARFMLQADRVVGEAGLAAGAGLILQRFTGGVTATGVEHIPAAGPLVILANHPGLADTVALFASIPRRDLLTIGLRRPFLEALPEMKRYVIFINEDRRDHYRALHQIVSHLKQGGAILTFPAGKIEPDPAVRPGAVESLATWAGTVAMFARLSVQPVLLPALVSGVLSPRAQRHPLTRLRRRPADREWLGATLQLLWPPYRRGRVSVQFGSALPAELLRRQGDDRRLFELFRAHMLPLIEQSSRR